MRTPFDRKLSRTQSCRRQILVSQSIFRQYKINVSIGIRRKWRAWDILSPRGADSENAPKERQNGAVTSLPNPRVV